MKEKKDKVVSLDPVGINEGILVFLDLHARTWTFPMYNVVGFMTEKIGDTAGEVRVFQRHNAPTVTLMSDIKDAAFQIDRWKTWVQDNVHVRDKKKGAKE